MVVRLVRCLERWAGFLASERVRLPLPLELPLPFDLPLPVDLRRANLRHLPFCRSIAALKDAPLISDSQETFLICSIKNKYYGTFTAAHNHARNRLIRVCGAACNGLGGGRGAYRTGCMQFSGFGLPRTPLLGTSVNSRLLELLRGD
jgi:hypothetical protein